MRIQLLSILFTLFIFSCSKSEDEGFFGEWEGESIIIVNGNPTVTSTSAKISDTENLSVECEITVKDLKYDFDATEGIDKLSFNKAPVKNVSDTLTQTYVTGTAKLIGDTLLVFEHQVLTMNGLFVISAVDYSLEFKRKE